LIAQQEQVKADMELQLAEYQKLVKDTQQFRGTYAYKMAELIDSFERAMRYNVEQITNSITEYSSSGMRH
jgi:hypothetical protein